MQNGIVEFVTTPTPHGQDVLANRMENYQIGVEHSARQVEKRRKASKTFVLTSLWKSARRQHYTPNPAVPNMADYLQWVLYDRAAVAAGSNWPTSTELYTQPIGQNSKTKADTNLEQVSLLPNPYWMNVSHLGLYPDPNVLLLDWIALNNQSYFEYWVNGRVQFEGKLSHAPGGVGPLGNSQKTAESSYSNGQPQMSNMLDLRMPAGINLGSMVTNGITGITILQGQNFKIKIILPGGVLALTASTATPNIGTGITLNASLFGQLSRSL